MDKALCYGALGVGALMALVFVLDLVAGVPFGGGGSENPFVVVDVFGFIGAVIVIYLGFNASRDLK
ncbi:hypothetical protein R5W24_001892 [Gemmata sp. JC717]|uniref:Uncharacterized protein n=1 Tax=Gemmata algarum TaxID=2975278 RepID=A0ABU5EUW2_9BACT|nr:hypothetical protein [Gemmata algarum]MDY3552803.1 hypothetical protein [Gemmata algarum]MDY3557516.1 hypothetical protein [Gemmata algarum]